MNDDARVCSMSSYIDYRPRGRYFEVCFYILGNALLVYVAFHSIYACCVHHHHHLRGHGTYIKNHDLISSRRGVVTTVNKLIKVSSVSRKYYGDVGDVVVGRVVEVANKRWLLDVNAPHHAVILLSSVNIPGSTQACTSYCWLIYRDESSIVMHC